MAAFSTSHPVTPSQRHSQRRDQPCLVCGGGADDRRGRGERCYGFISTDGRYEHCSRDEFAGPIPPGRHGLYAHRLDGPCNCGVTHGPGQQPQQRKSLYSERGSGAKRQNTSPRTFARYADLPTAKGGDYRLAATYPYQRADGALAFEIRRFERPNITGAGKPDKTFAQYTPRADGSWIEQLDAADRLLYGLPALLAAPLDAVVYVVEGEKAADALRSALSAAGIQGVVTTTPCGAKQGHLTSLEALRGRTCVIIPDNDTDGEQYAKVITERACGVGATQAVIAHLPNVQPKEDVVEWLNVQGGTAAELAGLAADALQADALQADARWEDPTPLPDGAVTVSVIDQAMLPAALWGWITDMAERMSVVPDFFAAPALVVACSLVGRRIGIHPKRHDNWLVVPNTNGGIVAPPGFLKSAALREVMRPLERLALAETEEYHQQAVAHEAEQMALAARKKAIEGEMHAAAKKRDTATLEALKSELMSLHVQEPTQRRYKVNDGTVEKIGMLLAENPQGLLIFRDELSGWLRTLDKSGHESDRAFYLEAWNGDGAFDVDRVGRGSLHIPALCLSILGGIQPGPLASYVFDASSDGAANDGLLQRFQLLVWPDLPHTYTHVDRWPNTEAKNTAYATLKGLATMTPEEVGAALDDPDDTDEIPAVRFADDAQGLFDEWYTGLQVRVRSGELSGPLAAHLSKYASLMPSLALVFHLMDLIDGQARRGAAVSCEATARAIAWCEYLETHARRLYASATNPAIERAEALLRRLKKGDIADGYNTRDIYRHGWEKLTTAEDTEAAIRVLEDFGWLCVDTSTGAVGRPAKRLRLHPSLRCESWDRIQ